jgi:multidrug efflux pump subunit AcrA (membrane-fusion protein)
MKTKGIILPIVAVGCLAYAAISIATTRPKRELTEPPMAPPRAPFSENVAAIGLVEPSSEMISLSAPLPGVVESVLVSVGQSVKKGDPLVKLDTRALEAMRLERLADEAVRKALLARTEAQLASLKANLDEAQRLRDNAEKLNQSRAISQDELIKRRSTATSLEASLRASQAEVQEAEAQLMLAQAATSSVEVDLERSTITAPIDATVLQIKIRPGEQATAESLGEDWMVLGQIKPLHIRADVDEHEAWRVKNSAMAQAYVRGNTRQQAALSFVRVEPLIVPKKSLTGASTERVDTRVYQVIYRLDTNDSAFIPGQQVDVFINAQ